MVHNITHVFFVLRVFSFLHFDSIHSPKTNVMKQQIYLNANIHHLL